jgi:hypothetical protein
MNSVNRIVLKMGTADLKLAEILIDNWRTKHSWGHQLHPVPSCAKAITCHPRLNAAGAAGLCNSIAGTITGSNVEIFAALWSLISPMLGTMAPHPERYGHSHDAQAKEVTYENR